MKTLDLGNEKISKLVNSFAIPCIASLIVASLYNIVDQIFIGRSFAGADGNAATNIVFPFVVIAMAFGLLFGDGMAALFNLSLGAKDYKKANKSIGNGLILLVLFSIFITIFGLIFTENIIKFFGGNPEETLCYTYSIEYFTIISLGLPFYIIGNGLNSVIRSDGSPKFAMGVIIIGMILNLILDPIFIFSLNLGVKGAAIATIISQFVILFFSVIYLFKPKKFSLTKDSIKLEVGILKRVISLGMPSLITQLTIVVVIAVMNNLILNFGNTTFASNGEPYGQVIPLAVIGICMKIFGIIMSVIIGFTLGGMPVIGYNMGAKKYDRVKSAIKYILTINTVISIIALIIFQLFPTYIINIFGTGNPPEYLEYAKYCFKIFLAGIVFTCILKSISIFLQSMGSSFKSTVIALSRDILFFIPLVIYITNISGNVVTMLWSALIADILGFILAVIFLKMEFVKMSKEKVNEVDDVMVSCVNNG